MIERPPNSTFAQRAAARSKQMTPADAHDKAVAAPPDAEAPEGAQDEAEVMPEAPARPATKGARPTRAR